MTVETKQAKADFESSQREWQHRIQFHLTAMGSVTGFTVAALSAVAGLTKGAELSTLEQYLIGIAIIALGLQIVLWLDQVTRERNIAFQFRQAGVAYLSEAKGKEDVATAEGEIKTALAQVEHLSHQNAHRMRVLNVCVHTSLLLVLLLILLRAF